MEELSEAVVGRFAKLLPVPVRQRVIGEVKILFLHAYHSNDDIMSKLKAPRFIPMYKDATIAELKSKISGLTGIPTLKLRLIYCGSILKNDKEFVPAEAFEINEHLREDDDLFRPRIHVSIQHVHTDPDDENSLTKSGDNDVDSLAEALRLRMQELRNNSESLPDVDDEVDDTSAPKNKK